jgi:palmitoyltransferase
MVDTFAKALGPIFVFGDFVLTFSVVAIAYSVGLPYYWDNKGPYITIPIVAFGQFFFINVIFHYYKALTTHPGRIPTSKPPDIDKVTPKRGF